MFNGEFRQQTAEWVCALRRDKGEERRTRKIKEFLRKEGKTS